MQRSDAELVDAACRGDIASFGELYERHYLMAAGIACSRLSDRHLAEDAAQEAFATACRRLSSLRDGRRFPEWLGTICRRTASRMARLQTNHRSVDDGPASTPQENDEGEAVARVRQAVERLSASGREVILLHYFSGLSYEEISQALGISPPSVHGRLQRARRALAKQLSEDDKWRSCDE
ncbi:MAG: RNA polymerase sigma factor [Pirellulaceae bacterium]